MMSPNNSVDLESMITLYKSRTNILNLIKELDLNIIIDSDDDEYVDISIQTDYFEEDYSKFFYLSLMAIVTLSMMRTKISYKTFN